jgi:hypothetical protein
VVCRGGIIERGRVLNVERTLISERLRHVLSIYGSVHTARSSLLLLPYRLSFYMYVCISFR